MKINWQIPKAILRRELTSYFSSPTGYVFIALFVFLGAVAAFWQQAFFLNNLANLDALNAWMPYLLVFLVPAITMASWADERRNGTDELLLTLPANDLEIALGKYFAMLGIFTVALVFSLSHVIVLLFLGSPDFGLLFATYLGYWLMGAAMLALGMLASLMASSLTVAFILGALLCAIPVFIQHADAIVGGRLARLLESLSFVEQFRDFSTGSISLSSLLYFVGFGATMLYLNVVMLGRRHWQTGEHAPHLARHHSARAVAALVALASVTILLGTLGGSMDTTAERIHSLSTSTEELIDSLDPDKPVFIQAYLSPDVPRRYLQTRNNITTMLRRFDSMGGSRIYSRVVWTDRYTDEARDAQDTYNIRPRPIPVFEQTAGGPDEIFMGVAFRSGGDELVVDFFDPGLPVEYELMRSIRVVSQSTRKKVGVLKTGINLFGGFDFQTRQRSADWSIVSELRKQYEVVQVDPATEYPDDLDAMIAVLPHTLSQDQVPRLADYVKNGKPTLLLVDPLPAFDMEKSPQQAPPNPFMQQQAPPPGPADVSTVFEPLGLEWPTSRITWDKYNPHPQFRTLPAEVVFLGAGNDEGQFNAEHSVTSGLQEVVLLYGGVLNAKEGSNVEITPLLETGRDSGVIDWSRLVQQTIFGAQLATNLPHEPDAETYMIAAQAKGEGDGGVNAIVVADVDAMGEQFFQLRRQGAENLSFDNVTFLLNAVDYLAGDESFIELRKRRRRHRTLETVEALTKDYEEERLEQTREAEENAETQLEAAQKRLDDAVAALQERTDLDLQTKRIMIANQQKIENRRLTVARTNIEDEKQRVIERGRGDMEAGVRRIQNGIKLAAVALSPVPAFALFLFVSVGRLRREQTGVSRDRLVEK